MNVTLTTHCDSPAPTLMGGYYFPRSFICRAPPSPPDTALRLDPKALTAPCGSSFIRSILTQLCDSIPKLPRLLAAQKERIINLFDMIKIGSA